MTDNEFNPIFLLEKDISIDNVQIDQNEVSDARFIHGIELKEKIGTTDFNVKPDREKYHRLMFEFFLNNH